MPPSDHYMHLLYFPKSLVNLGPKQTFLCINHHQPRWPLEGLYTSTPQSVALLARLAEKACPGHLGQVDNRSGEWVWLEGLLPGPLLVCLNIHKNTYHCKSVNDCQMGNQLHTICKIIGGSTQFSLTLHSNTQIV